MKVSIKPVLFLLLSSALLLGGCASFGPSAEADAAEALHQFHEAEITGDVNGMVNAFSDTWSNSEGATKSVLRGYFEGAVAQGSFRNLTVDEDRIKYAVNGNIVTAEPVIYNAATAPATFVYKLKLESDGVWRIIRSDQIR